MRDKLITVNSLSGGKTSSYIAANYPADYNIFALVRTNDKSCLFPDKKLRQIVSDKIGAEFIGTLEDDMIIHTMLDLEQHIGSKIDWVAADAFEDIIVKKGNYIPNKVSRYCTTELKIRPIQKYWLDNFNDAIEMRIGFRANEQSRAKNMISKLNADGFTEDKMIVGSKNNRNIWKLKAWRKPIFPLITDGIFKDTITEYWRDKPVRFAELNNCTGCFWRNPLLLKKMYDKHTNKLDWFAEQEVKCKGTWRSDIAYYDIKKAFSQIELSFDDFDECDSGYCGY